MTPLWLDRLQDLWNTPGALLFRAVVRAGLRLAALFLRACIWQLRLLWARLNGRARAAVLLAALILTASSTKTLAPSLSAVAEGLGVLVLAGIAIRMMLASPFRRRRF